MFQGSNSKLVVTVQVPRLMQVGSDKFNFTVSPVAFLLNSVMRRRFLSTVMRRDFLSSVMRRSTVMRPTVTSYSEGHIRLTITFYSEGLQLRLFNNCYSILPKKES